MKNKRVHQGPTPQTLSKYNENFGPKTFFLNILAIDFEKIKNLWQFLYKKFEFKIKMKT